MKTMVDVRTIVNEVLSQLGNSREAQYYLKQFSGLDTLRFAVVKIGGGVLEAQLEPLASALAFLRHLGLMPIILHGAGPQLDRALGEAGVETRRQDGLRVTTEEVMAVARPVIYRANRDLVKALEAHDVWSVRFNRWTWKRSAKRLAPACCLSSPAWARAIQGR